MLEELQETIRGAEERIRRLEARSRWWRELLRWTAVVLVPAVITVVGGYLFTRYGFPGVDLHVVVEKYEEEFSPPSVGGAVKPDETRKAHAKATGPEYRSQLGDEYFLQVRHVYRLVIHNEGTERAEGPDNHLSVGFNGDMQSMHMAPGNLARGGIEETDKSRAEECETDRQCTIEWSTITGGGSLTMAFSFLDSDVTFQKFPRVFHGGKQPGKWTCCNLPDHWQLHCEALPGRSWYNVSEIVKVFVGKDEFCQ